MSTQLAVIIAIIATLIVTLMVFTVYEFSRRIKALERDADRKRHTQSTEAGILDTEADVDAWIRFLELNLERAESMKRKLNKLMEGPHAYPKEGKFK